jgi:serine protease Do
MSNSTGPLIALLAVAAADPAGAQGVQPERTAPQRLVYEVKPAVVMVRVAATVTIPRGRGRDPITYTYSTGASGWIISPDGYVVTNGHVVEVYHADNEASLKYTLTYMALDSLNFFAEEAARRNARLTDPLRRQLLDEFIAANSGIALAKRLDVILQNGQRLPAEIKQYSPPLSDMPGKVSSLWVTRETGKDVAVLKIEGRDLPTLRLGDSHGVRIGDDVMVVGYPEVVRSHGLLDRGSELEVTFTWGRISSEKRSQQGVPVFQMDASTTWGNSGGPVMNGRGEVIAMTTFGSIADLGTAQQAIQGFNFAVPVNTVREFVAAASVETEQTSLFDVTWRRALDAYDAGSYAQAIASIEHALRIVPDLRDAVRLRQEAVRQLPPQPPRGTATRPSWSMTGPAAGAVVLLTAGLAWGLRRSVRGRARPVSIGPDAAPGRGRVPAATARSFPARLVVQEGPERGRTVPLSMAGVRIGRDPRVCQLVLTDGAVSREHVLVMPSSSGAAVVVRNLSRTNPTIVNGQPVSVEASIERGGHIRIGGSVIVLEEETQAVNRV